LAIINHVFGNYEQAELLLQRALKIFEKHLEPAHPEIAHTLYELAVLLHEQGKHEQAENLYQRSTSIKVQRLGATHPHLQVNKKDYEHFLRRIGYDSKAEAKEVNDEPSV
jgi:tetratricopeptide (TPR) repeat protein